MKKSKRKTWGLMVKTWMYQQKYFSSRQIKVSFLYERQCASWNDCVAMDFLYAREGPKNKRIAREMQEREWERPKKSKSENEQDRKRAEKARASGKEKPKSENGSQQLLYDIKILIRMNSATGLNAIMLR